MIFSRRALALALAGCLAVIPAIHAQAAPSMTFTFTDAAGNILGTQSIEKGTCTDIDPAIVAAGYARGSAENQQTALNLYDNTIAAFCEGGEIVSTVGYWDSPQTKTNTTVTTIRWEGLAPTTYTPGQLIYTPRWPPGMAYQTEVTDNKNVFHVDETKGKKVVAMVSVVLVIGVAMGAWKVYKAASYVKPPELMKKKKEPKDRSYTGVVGAKKVKKKHAYYRKPAHDANGNLISSGADGEDDKNHERYRDDEEEERYDEYGRRMYKDENGEWQVVYRDSSDDTDSEEEERRKKADKRRRRAQAGGNGRRNSNSSESDRDHSSAAANKTRNNNGSSMGFLKLGNKRSSAGSSTLASSHQPSSTRQYTALSGRASPQPVMIDMQETNYQQRRPMGSSPAVNTPSTAPGNTFTPPPPQPSTVTTYNLPPPAHTQIDLMRFDNSSPAPSAGRNHNNTGYDPHQNPYQQQRSTEVVVSMPQQYNHHHHPTSPTRRGGYSSNQRF